MARHLISLGFDASALAGGMDAWAEQFPLEPIEEPTQPAAATAPG